jgi:hypothetical protein
LKTPFRTSFGHFLSLNPVRRHAVPAAKAWGPFLKSYATEIKNTKAAPNANMTFFLCHLNQVYLIHFFGLSDAHFLCTDEANGLSGPEFSEAMEDRRTY